MSVVRKTGAKSSQSKSKKANKKKNGKANENWLATERDKLATQYAAAMMDARWGEVRRRADRKKLIERAYELADAQIEFAMGKV